MEREELERVRAIIKEPNDLFGHVKEIKNELRELQDIVGGYIETVMLRPGLIVVCNEEGLINDMPFNCRVGQIMFFGTIIVLGAEGEEFTDVPIGMREWAKMMEDKK